MNQFEVHFIPQFESWREQARNFLSGEVLPARLIWRATDDDVQAHLFADLRSSDIRRNVQYKVPKEFLDQARYVAAHRDSGRWDLLYRVLWRLTHEEPELLKIVIDEDSKRFHSMFRSVRRDLHKMKAFVRFQSVSESDGDRFIAWYRPDHYILRLAAPFFQNRFNSMKWSILTQDECMHWDLEKLTFSEGVPQHLAGIGGDQIENLWKTYYESIFNPARIKLKAMKKELPVRYWRTLPESQLIQKLIRQAPMKLEEFYQNQPKSARSFLPPKVDSLRDARIAASLCKACSFCDQATQTVFGEGPENATVVMVGEQPGNEEDLKGKPFVGPAGKLLRSTLAEISFDTSQVYFTNAVKHFKWKPQGKVRLHQKPSAADISACHPWLQIELNKIQPKVLVCLGVTAAQSVFGKSITIQASRGKWFKTAFSEYTLITTHPSAILRTPDPELQRIELEQFKRDLGMARDMAAFGPIATPGDRPDSLV